MRIDKYLKLTRIIKRRQVSKDIIIGGHVKINNKTFKPAANVKVGDKIMITFFKTIVEVEVINIEEKFIKKTPDLAYKIISEQGNEN